MTQWQMFVFVLVALSACAKVEHTHRVELDNVEEYFYAKCVSEGAPDPDLCAKIAMADAVDGILPDPSPSPSAE